MTADTALTGEVIEEISRAISAVLSEGNITFRAGDLIWNQSLARATEQAVLQSPEVQALRDLLKEARQQLPLAAQFWNEDDEPERGGRNVGHVMELIARIDAAMEKQP